MPIVLSRSSESMTTVVVGSYEAQIWHESHNGKIYGRINVSWPSSGASSSSDMTNWLQCIEEAKNVMEEKLDAQLESSRTAALLAKNRQERPK